MEKNNNKSKNEKSEVALREEEILEFWEKNNIFKIRQMQETTFSLNYFVRNHFVLKFHK